MNQAERKHCHFISLEVNLVKMPAKKRTQANSTVSRYEVCRIAHCGLRLGAVKRYFARGFLAGFQYRLLFFHLERGSGRFRIVVGFSFSQASSAAVRRGFIRARYCFGPSLHCLPLWRSCS